MMEIDKHKTCKNINLRSLCLKNNNLKSSGSTSTSNLKSSSESDTNNKETNNKNKLDSSNDDDSLTEFMSPKIKKKNPKAIINKFKINKNKTKQKVLKHTGKSKTKIKTKNSDADQPLIESSFFKQQSTDNEIKKSIPCPLCLKPFKDDITCTNHMKTCASKNKISTRQLLKAKQLQDRQIEERKAMGLLPTPVLAEKKKVFRSRNFSTEDDPQIQLALAVSESLYQAEQKVELEEAALLAGIPANFVTEITNEEHRATLQKFGFTTNKPINDVPSTRSRKKKLSHPTILQTRSKEEKDRVLTERIACILTGDDAFTQPSQNAEIVQELKSPIILKNKLLREIEQVKNKLWDKSKLTEKCDFYVKELKSHFLPEEKQKIDYDNKSDEKNILQPKTVEHETMDLELIYNQSAKEENSLLSPINNPNNKHWELSYTNNIIFDWRSGLNDITFSDIIIFVKNNEYIYAHKLVFHIRQSNILHEIKPNDTNINPKIQNKICLFENDKLPTLAFLEYIYCGNIENSISVFDDNNLLSQVKELGVLYPVKDLFEYLKKKKDEYSIERLKNSKNLIEVHNSELESTTSMHLNETIMINNLNKTNVNEKELAYSPDLFESDNEDDEIYRCETVKVGNNETYKDSAKLINVNNDILKENIETSQNKKRSNEIKCMSPEIIEISSPERNFSPLDNIYQAVTPKKLLPHNITTNYDINLNSSIISKDTELEINERNTAVTPKSNKSSTDYCITPKKIVYADIEVHNTCHDKASDDEYLIHNAVTPPKSDINKKNHYKLKSNLSQFIDRVQRQNAKSIFESDSDTDTPEFFHVRKRNPFLKINSEDSYSYLLNNRNKTQYKTHISLIEKAVLEDEKCKKEFDGSKSYSKPIKAKRLLNDSKVQDISNVTLLNADLNISLQDKYSKINNSKDISNVTPVSLNTESQNIELSHNKFTKDSKQNEKSVNSPIAYDISHPSISDDESNLTPESQLSRYSRYRRANKHHNSIAKYREELKRINFFSNMNKAISTESSSEKITNSGHDDITLVSDSDEEKKNSTTSNIVNDYNSSYGLSTNQPNQSAVSTSKKSLLKENSNENINSNLINISIESNTTPKQMNKSKCEEFFEISKKKNDDGDSEIEKILQSSAQFTCEDEEFFEISKRKNDNVDSANEKILQSNTQNTNKQNTLLKKYAKSSSQKKSSQEILNLSPISIVSSPEVCKLDKNKANNKTQKFKILLDSFKENKIDASDLIKYFDEEINNQCVTKSSLTRENDKNQNDLCKSIVNSNSYTETPTSEYISWKVNNEKLNLSSNPSTSKKVHISNLISSPILSQSSIQTRVPFSNSSPKETKLSESPDKLLKKCRKLQTKSASTSFITPGKSNLLQNFSTCEEGITPPVDYNLLKTPDLQKELNKFGLKHQNRNRAALLLNHIYKETHPLVTLSQKRTPIYSSSSDDEEPLYKKKNLRKKFKRNTNSESNIIQNCSTIDEEMDYNERNIINVLEKCVNIKDTFLKIIEDNKELYTNILTYKPLPLEPLHLMLKVNGCKCNIHDLENFLDEQCITYQTTKQNDRRKDRNRQIK